MAYCLFKFILVLVLVLLPAHWCVLQNGCDQVGGNGETTCYFATWKPPLVEFLYFNKEVYTINVINVDGTIPSGAFSGISDSKLITPGKIPKLSFNCGLENIILSENVFTSNLNWIEELTFEGCYIQDGISSNMLSNLTSLKKFEVKSGIIGPLTSTSFAGLTNIGTIIIDADFLDPVLPSGLFSGLTNLEELQLKSAGLSSIPVDTFNGLSRLKTLDLSENAMTTLPEGLFQSLMSLSTVMLGTNSWSCTCDLSWLSTWSLLTEVSVDVNCSTPSSLAGINLNRAVATLGCLDSVTTKAATDSAGAVASSGTGSSSSGAGSSSNEDSTLIYVALGAAAFACLVAIGISIAICCMRSNASSLSQGKSKVQPKTYNRYPETASPPPSYRSSDRMFIQTPVETTRNVRKDPYFDVKYHP